MAPHSSTLAWEIPWAEEPGRLKSMGSQRVDSLDKTHTGRDWGQENRTTENEIAGWHH